MLIFYEINMNFKIMNSVNYLFYLSVLFINSLIIRFY